MRNYVDLPSTPEPSTLKIDCHIKQSSFLDFMRQLIKGSCLQKCFEDKEISYLTNTLIGDKRADLFTWLKTNDNRYSHISSLAQYVFSIQASSDHSEVHFSEAGSVVTALRGHLSDDSISVGILVRAWARLLRKCELPTGKFDGYSY